MATQQLTIPMFPLNMVLLPGETQTLHIFEERYKQLINDCIENDAHFGIPFINNKTMLDFGIEVKIIKVLNSHSSGELDITIEGLRVFKLIEFSHKLSPKLYGAGVIHFEDEILTPPCPTLQEMIKDYMWISQQSVIPIDSFDKVAVYAIARLLELTSNDKYELIKAHTLFEKETILKSKIKLIIHIIKVEHDLQGKFIFN